MPTGSSRGASISGGPAPAAGALTLREEGRAELEGALTFVTVSRLLPEGESAIREGRVQLIDLAGVTTGDSAGLALLIEWLSVAKSAGRELRYRNVPAQLTQLARVSEVEALMDGTAAAA